MDICYTLHIIYDLGLIKTIYFWRKYIECCRCWFAASDGLFMKIIL